jgi:hypothetical protein
MNCDLFHERLAELAVGSLDAPERTDVLAHAARCAPCQSALERMSVVADRILDETPEIEPPPGFEQRVLSQLSTATTGTNALAATGTTGRPPLRMRSLALVACLVLLAATASAVIVRNLDEREQLSTVLHPVRTGTIVRADGRPSGQVTLADQPRPLLVITIDHPRQFAGRVSCELEAANGQKVLVGSWSYDDIEAGAWSVGLTAEQLTSVRMNVVDATGKVLSSAQLS